MDSFQESPENFSVRGNGSHNGAHNWHRPFTQSSPPDNAGNGQFQQDQYNPNNIPPPLPSYTNLNIPQHTPTNGQSALEDVPPRRRSGSGSGGSEFNSEGGSPNNSAAGAPYGVGGPLSSSSGMHPSNPSMSSSPLVEGSNLFQPISGGMEYSAALMSAVSTNNPGLMRQYVQMFGNAAGQRRQRSEKKPIPDEQKDEKYFERRRRNNSAAKRSRLLKRERNEALETRIQHLERVNLRLKAQMEALRPKQATLRQLTALHDSVLATIDVQAVTGSRRQWNVWGPQEAEDMDSTLMFPNTGQVLKDADFFRNAGRAPKGAGGATAEVFPNSSQFPKDAATAAEFLRSIYTAPKDAKGSAEMIEDPCRMLGNPKDFEGYFKHGGAVPKTATGSPELFQDVGRERNTRYEMAENARSTEGATGSTLPLKTGSAIIHHDRSASLRPDLIYGGYFGMQQGAPELTQREMMELKGMARAGTHPAARGGATDKNQDAAHAMTHPGMRNPTQRDAALGTQGGMKAVTHPGTAIQTQGGMPAVPSIRELMQGGVFGMAGHLMGNGMPGAVDLTQDGMAGMKGLAQNGFTGMQHMVGMKSTGDAGMFGLGRGGSVASPSEELESEESDEDIQ